MSKIFVHFRTAILGLCTFGFTYIDTASAFHLRLHETSITENGRIHNSPSTRLQTKGFGLAYIFKNGLGVSYTALESKNQEASSGKYDLLHNYLDLSFTAGDTWLTTFGYGIGVSGSLKTEEQSSKEFSATAYHLGVGYRYDKFEVYWINRLNFPRYKVEEGTVIGTLTHYQLGLGIKLD